MSIARSYAKALFEAALASKTAPQELDQLEQEIDVAWKTMTSSKEAKIALLSPAISAKDKAAVLREISKRLQLSPLISNFLQLLGLRARLRFLPEIREAFQVARLEAEGGVLGRLVSADPMEPQDIDELASAFGKKLGRRVAFQAATDPTLLAGIKITVNGVTYDGTLRSQLQRLRERLVYGTGMIH